MDFRHFILDFPATSQPFSPRPPLSPWAPGNLRANAPAWNMPDALWLGGTGAAGRRAERYRWSGHVFAHSNIHILVGGFKNCFYFPYHIWDFILSIDELIFFKMVIAPPTRFLRRTLLYPGDLRCPWQGCRNPTRARAPWPVPGYPGYLGNPTE